MLNLCPIFQDAIDVLSQHASHLGLPALPATVHLMQRDVINHYRYAATHYLPLTLNEHFLQNSSIGTPYEKWAKFTNEDFNRLAFTVTTLMRYTTRLIHETESVALKAEKRFREASARSNAYISPLVEIDHRNRQIGIHVNADESLAVTPFSTKLTIRANSECIQTPMECLNGGISQLTTRALKRNVSLQNASIKNSDEHYVRTRCMYAIVQFSCN